MGPIAILALIASYLLASGLTFGIAAARLEYYDRIRGYGHQLSSDEVFGCVMSGAFWPFALPMLTGRIVLGRLGRKLAEQALLAREVEAERKRELATIEAEVTKLLRS